MLFTEWPEDARVEMKKKTSAKNANGDDNSPGRFSPFHFLFKKSPPRQEKPVNVAQNVEAYATPFQQHQKQKQQQKFPPAVPVAA